MASKRDYYEVLGLSKSATDQEIKQAHRKLAKQYHPDINKEPGAEEKFKEIQEAYEVLSDPQKRQKYDQFGHAAFDPNSGAGQGGFGGFGGFQDVDLGDIFGSFFGGGSQRRRPNTGPQRGNDRFMTVRIDFMDAIKGKKVELNIPLEETCDVCGGTGARTPNDVVNCTYCQGRGYTTKRVQNIFGMIQETQSTCPSCNGEGKTVKDRCVSCNGKGFNKSKKKIDVNIPAGINNGQQIRVTGKGERGTKGGPNGDLYIEIVVDTDKFFKREGNDIHVELEMGMVDAALGAQIEIPTVYGNVDLKIPEGTQNGHILKLREKGVKDIRSDRFGDQYVHIKVKTPTKLSNDQKELLRKFQEFEEKTSKNETFFDKIKKKMKK